MKDIATALDDLRQGDFRTRWEATTRLSAHEPAALPYLLELLKDAATDSELQWFIAKILGAYPEPDAILALATLLQTATDDDVCAQVAQSLARLGGNAIAPLLPLLQDPQRLLMAVSALAQINQPEVLPVLRAAFPTAPASSRVLILEAIAPFQDPQSRDVIHQGLADENAAVCRAAIAALVASSEVPIEARVERIAPFLNDPRPTVPEAAAHALGRLPTETAAIALIQKCCDPLTMPNLYPILIQSLGWIGSNTALAGLVTLWDQLNQASPPPDPLFNEILLKAILTSVSRFTGAEVRMEAALKVLEWVRSPLLLDIPSLKCQGILSLGRLADPPLMYELIDLLAAPEYVVQLHVIAALKQLAAEDAYQAIQRRAEDENLDENLAAGLAIALREW